MTFAQEVKPIVTDVMVMLQGKLRDKAVEQGHHLTGFLAQSIVYDVNGAGDEVTARMYAADYAAALEFGVKAEKIPYGNGKAGAKTSLYIQGLITYWEDRGLGGREAVGAAFATAKVHAREGMPSRGSHQFSATGRRTGFVTETIEENLEAIVAIIEERYGVRLILSFGELFAGYDNLQFLA